MVYFCITVIGDKNFSVCKFFRKLYFTCILAEIAVYDQFFIAKCTDISVDILVIIKDQIIGTVYDQFTFMAELDQFLIIFEYGIFAVDLISGIDLSVDRVYHNPGVSCGETCVSTVVPLHRGSCIVTSLITDCCHHVLFGHLTLFG